MKDRVLNRILDFFRGSSDFNGILLSQLGDEMKLSWADLQSIVAGLMNDENVTLAFASYSITLTSSDCQTYLSTNS